MGQLRLEAHDIDKAEPFRTKVSKFGDTKALASKFMPAARFSTKHRPRELRRRVLLPARIKYGAQWSDGCILNVSTRGMMIQTGKPLSEGSLVELRRGDEVIIGEVVWRSGPRAGLRSIDRVPVETILSSSAASALQLVATDGRRVERRKIARESAVDARLRARTIQLIGIGAIAASFALGVAALVARSLDHPFATIEAVLPG